LPSDGLDKEHTEPMENRKKTLVMAAIVAVGLSLVAGTVAAQDYFTPLFSAYVDHTVPGDSPCGYSPIRQVTPSTYEDTIMLWYLCEDNRVIARRFFRTGGSSRTPQPVYFVNPQDYTPPPTVSAPGQAPAGCPAGLVPAVNGGCVDRYHPLAR
jgi:hypothetical protein